MSIPTRILKPLDLTPDEKASIAIRLEKMSMPEPMSGCWLWLAAVCVGSGQFGYGRIQIRGDYPELDGLD